MQEFKDWYSYACKLEDSVKYLRDRTNNLETDHDALNEKYRKEVASREQLFRANEELNKALRRAHLKIGEIKDKFQAKLASKKCYYCNGPVASENMLAELNAIG